MGWGVLVCCVAVSERAAGTWENGSVMNEIAKRVRLEIDLGTLRQNFENVSTRVSPCGVIAVLKANAYGLGVDRIAATLADAGVAGFAAAELSEALELLPFG